jgi:hypothetical protein
MKKPICVHFGLQPPWTQRWNVKKLTIDRDSNPNVWYPKKTDNWFTESAIRSASRLENISCRIWKLLYEEDLKRWGWSWFSVVWLCSQAASNIASTYILSVGDMQINYQTLSLFQTFLNFPNSWSGVLLNNCMITWEFSLAFQAANRPDYSTETPFPLSFIR